MGRSSRVSYHLMELARYVVLNPVRAGLCSEAGGWKWSSYGAVMGELKRAGFLTVEWLIGQFGKDPGRARETFRQFVLDAPSRARPRELFGLVPGYDPGTRPTQPNP